MTPAFGAETLRGEHGVYSLAATVREWRARHDQQSVRLRLVDPFALFEVPTGSPFGAAPEVVILTSLDPAAVQAASRAEGDVLLLWPEDREPETAPLAALITALRSDRPAARIDIALPRRADAAERLFEAGARGLIGGPGLEDWPAVLERHRRAQSLGFESDLVLPFGSTLSSDVTEDRLQSLAQLQAETGRVRAVTPLPVGSPDAPRDSVTTGVEDLCWIATVRSALPPTTRVRADWPTLTPRGAQLALTFGADEIIGLAGPETPPGTEDHPATLTHGRLEKLVRDAGLEIES